MWKSGSRYFVPERAPDRSGTPANGYSPRSWGQEEHCEQGCAPQGQFSPGSLIFRRSA